MERRGDDKKIEAILMKLSKLQQFILLECWRFKGKKVSRREFLKFYDGYERKPEKKEVVKIITKSLERLIKRNFIVGFGKITEEKIFIEAVCLTAFGKQEMRKIMNRQQKLPLKVRSPRLR